MSTKEKLKPVSPEVTAKRVSDAIQYMYMNPSKNGQRGRFQISRKNLYSVIKMCGNKRNIHKTLLVYVVYACAEKGLALFSLAQRQDDMVFICSADYLLSETVAFSDEELAEMVKDIPTDLGQRPFCAHLGQKIMALHPGKPWGWRPDQVETEIIARMNLDLDDSDQNQSDEEDDEEDGYGTEEDEDEIDLFDIACQQAQWIEDEIGFGAGKTGAPVICASPVAIPADETAFIACMPRDLARDWRLIDDKMTEEAARYGRDTTIIEP